MNLMRPLFLAAFGVFSAVAFVSSAGEMTQTVIDNSDLGPPTLLQFEPFFNVVDGTTRQLIGVEINYDGDAEMEVVVENFDTAPYAANEWYYDVFHSVLLSFDAKPGFPNGGPFFFMGGLALQGITGDLSEGDGGGFPFLMGTPGDVVVTASTNGIVTANMDVDSSFLEFFAIDGDAAGGVVETINANLGSFTEALLTPPPLDNGFASINARITELTQVGALNLIYRFVVPGDLNADDLLNARDIDQLYQLIEIGDPTADLNGDELLDQKDVDWFLAESLNSVYGDSNLDGTFDSSDLVFVFQSGEYEDSLAANSSWASGDWNGDEEFDSSDLVFAFQVGTYVSAAQVNNVPEPAVGFIAWLMIVGSLFMPSRRKRLNNRTT